MIQPERPIAPTLRLGRLALDWEMVTPRQVLQLRLAAEEVAGIGFEIPAGDLFVHLGIMRPNEVHLLLAKAGSDDRELAVRSPLADVTPRVQEMAEEAFALGEVFPEASIEAVLEIRQRLRAVGIELSPWQVLAYRGELDAERRVALEVARSDRERERRRIDVRDDGRRTPGRILRASPGRREIPVALVATAIIAATLVLVPLAGWSLFSRPGRSAPEADATAAAAGPATAPENGAAGDPGGRGGALAAAIGRPGVRVVGRDPGGAGRSDPPPVPVRPFESNPEAVRAMLPGAPAGAPEPAGAPLAIRASSGSADGRTAVRVAARAELPDGVWLDLVLSYRGVPVVARRVPVKDGAFDVQFDLPGPGRAPSGVYEAAVTFHPARQHQALARRLAAEIPEGYQARLPVAVGSPAEAESEARAVRERLAELLRSIGEARRTLHETARDASGSGVPIERWNSFLARWREAVQASIETPLSREASEYLVPPLPEASAAARSLASLLVDLGREVSRRVHRARGLEPPVEDARPMIELERDEAALAAAIDHLAGALESAVVELEAQEKEREGNR